MAAISGEVKFSPRLRNWGIGFVCCIVAIIVCYFWLDRSVALWLHEYVSPYKSYFVLLTRLLEPLATIIGTVAL